MLENRGRVLFYVLAALCTITLGQHEWSRYRGAHALCADLIAVHAEFTRHAVCAAHGRLPDYERLGLTRCTEARRYLLSEDAHACALRTWASQSSFGNAGASLAELWGKVTGWFWLCAVLPFLALTAYWIRSRERAETERHAMNLEAQSSTHSGFLQALTQMQTSRWSLPAPPRAEPQSGQQFFSRKTIPNDGDDYEA